MIKKEFSKAKEEEFVEDDDGINIDDIELGEMQELLDDMFDNLMEAGDCEHCQKNVLKLAILIAFDLGRTDAKYEMIHDLHCQLANGNCEECEE